MSEEKKQLSEKLQKIVDQIKELSIMEVADLVKALEDEFGVSAAAPVMMGPMPGAPAGDAGAQAEEKTEFDVVLESFSNKIAALKAVRKLKPEMGLSEANNFIKELPKVVLEAVSKEDAEKAKKDLEAAGCTVKLK